MDYWQCGSLGSVRGKRIFDFWWHRLREGMQHGRRERSSSAWVDPKTRKKKRKERKDFVARVGIKNLIFGFKI